MPAWQTWCYTIPVDRTTLCSRKADANTLWGQAALEDGQGDTQSHVPYRFTWLDSGEQTKHNLRGMHILTALTAEAV